MRRTIHILMALCCLLSVAAFPAKAQDSPWRAIVGVEQTEALLGSVVYVTVEITNTSEEAVVVTGSYARCGGYCGLAIEAPSSDTEEQCVRISKCGADYPLERYLSKRTVEPGEVLVSRREQFQPRCAGSYKVYFSCDVPSSVTEPEVNSKTGEPVSNDEVWHGSFTSNEVTFQAVEPKGLDAEVYEAFGHNPIDRTPSDRAQLLERFPASTYAALLVDDMSSPNLQAYAVGDEIRTMEAMRFPTTYLPCSKPIAGTCRDVGVGPAGTEAAKRNTAWIDLVLQHHPEVRFADKLRYKRAFAAYFLSEKADCTARLETLTKTASPEVAARARDLLEAMRAAGLVGPEPEGQGDDQ